MNLFHNIPKVQMNVLPADVLEIICSYLRIDTLKNLCVANKNLDIMLNKNFWSSYFKLYDISIINQQNTALGWTYEFMTMDLIKRVPSVESVSCQYDMKRGYRKGSKCTKMSSPGNIYCALHSKRTGNDTYKSFILIECACDINPYFDNEKIFIQEKYVDVRQRDNNTIFINTVSNFYMIQIDSYEGILAFRFDKQKSYDLLFNLFENNDIIHYSLSQ